MRTISLLANVQITTDSSSRVGKRLVISGLNILELKKDIRSFFGKNIPAISTSGVSMSYHIFSIVVRSVFFGSANISFEEFFVVEVKKVFEWLYERFKRSSYKEVVDLLAQHPRIQALEKPMEEVPAEIMSKVDNLGTSMLINVEPSLAFLVPSGKNFIPTIKIIKTQINIIVFLMLTMSL